MGLLERIEDWREERRHRRLYGILGYQRKLRDEVWWSHLKDCGQCTRELLNYIGLLTFTCEAHVEELRRKEPVKDG